MTPQRETGTSTNTTTSKGAIEQLKKLFDEGRPIVPFLGAGVSAGSGFPLTETLREYLCKTKFFIRHSVYRSLLGRGLPGAEQIDPFDYEYRTADYLMEFGWPDFNRLTADLWRYAEKPFGDGGDADVNRDEWWSKLRGDPNGPSEEEKSNFRRAVSYLDRCYESLRPQKSGDDARAIRRQEFFDTCGISAAKTKLAAGVPIWGYGRNRLLSLVEFMLLEFLKVEDLKRAESIERQVWEHKLRIRCDWFALLHDLVEGRRGLADELLAQLNRNRTPGLSHLMLAHLAKRLSWRLILTLNHDSLLEKAFQSEGVVPKVFDVNMASGVPDPTLVRREPLSLIKLHGSAYGLRLGESTNDELDDATRARILKYIPDDAVLLVLGFSGYERRMMSLIEAVASEAGSSRRIVWMYWNAPEEPVNRLKERLDHHNVGGRRSPISLYGLDDAGTFLKGMYQRFTNTLPETNTAYLSLPKRVRSDRARTERPSSPASTLPHQEPVHLFVRSVLHATGQEKLGSYDPKHPWKGLVKEELANARNVAKDMAPFVQAQRGYDTIWIDLEDHHTVTGVVAEIISQMRVFDPNLPPLVLPVSETPSGMPPGDPYGRAVRYLHRALLRGRYILAFDSLEGFGRPQTVHHGLVSLKPTQLTNLPQYKAADSTFLAGAAFEEQFARDLMGEHPDGPSTSSQIRSSPDFDERIKGYRRLLGLLKFLELLLHVDGSDGKMESNPLDIDWYCCIAIDIPQPRHHLSKTDKSGGPLPVQGIWELSFYALSRFVRSVKKCHGDASEATSPNGSRVKARFHLDRENSLKGGADESASDPTPTNMDRRCVRELLQALRGDEVDGAQVSTTLDNLLAGSIDYGVDRLASRLRTTLFSDDKDSTFLFLLMCFFRRPRNVSSLKSLVERSRWLLLSNEPVERSSPRFAGEGEERASEAPGPGQTTLYPHFDIESSLNSLLTVGLVHRNEGEIYFIPQHVHEAMYKCMSWTCRLNDLKPKDPGEQEIEEKNETLSNRLADTRCWARASWLGRTHSLIAREYYVNIWQRSRDIHALFEYLYHRLASLKYLLILRTMVQVIVDEKQATIPESATIRRLWPIDSSAGDKGRIAPDELLKHIDQTRFRYLLALINVLERERSTILTSATGDTWRNWMDQILSRDLSEIFGGISRDEWAHDHTSRFLKAWIREPEASVSGIGVNFGDLRKRLEIVLSEIKGMLCREMGDHNLCVKARIELLTIIGFVGDENGSANNGRRDQLVRALTDYIDSAWVHGTESLYAKCSKLPGVKNRFRSVRSAVGTIEAAIIDIAASGRHVEPCSELAPSDRAGLDVSTRLLQAFVNAARTPVAAGASVDVGLDMPAIVSGLHVAALRCDFESLRLKADTFLEKRFRLASFVGEESSASIEGTGSAGSRAKEMMAKVKNLLSEVICAERYVYGAPFEYEAQFSLQVARFATLKGSLMSLLGQPWIDEALRLFEEAISGFTSKNADHVFHRVIVHTQRAYALMSAAEWECRRSGAVNSSHRSQPQFDFDEMNEIRYRRLPVAERRLTEARAELSHAEDILGTGRRNARVWLRLYRAKAQLAIEQILRLALVVEVSPNSFESTNQFVAEAQEVMLYGLEAIRGALDCSQYPAASLSEDGSRSAKIVQEKITPEMRESATTDRLYLFLFIACRVLLKGYMDSRHTPPVKKAPKLGDLVEKMQSSRDLDDFVGRWKALNESVGLTRSFHYFGEPPQEESPQGELRWIKWDDFCKLCEPQNGGPSLREFAQRCMREIMASQLAIRFGAKLVEKKDLKGIPWVLHLLFHQRERRQMQRS